MLLALLASLWSSLPAATQDLVPGAYTPAPVGFNIVTLVATINKGDIAFDPALPVTDGRATLGGTAVGYSRTLNLAGRMASIGVAMPYVLGHVQGLVLGQAQEASRSGPADLSGRFAVNLRGAPALSREQFASYRQATIVGVSVTVTAPIGQYDPSRVVNIGTHRWAVKPELGVSRRRGRWTAEGDLGATVFSDNSNYVNGGLRQQAPIVSVQGHLIYTIRPGLWLAGDGNFWSGGRLTTNGIEGTERQDNSRLGATLAVPVRRQQVRISYSFGAFTTIGGDFQSVGVSYSYVWAARPSP